MSLLLVRHATVAIAGHDVAPQNRASYPLPAVFSNIMVNHYGRRRIEVGRPKRILSTRGAQPYYVNTQMRHTPGPPLQGKGEGGERREGQGVEGRGGEGDGGNAYSYQGRMDASAIDTYSTSRVQFWLFESTCSDIQVV